MTKRNSILWSDKIVEEIQNSPTDTSQAGAAQWMADLIEAVKQYNLKQVVAIKTFCPISSVRDHATVALRLM
jgi:hypothetical protein